MRTAIAETVEKPTDREDAGGHKSTKRKKEEDIPQSVLEHPASERLSDR
jgi:hypothetical protein